MKIIDLIYPRRCPVCDRPAPGERLICPECENVPKRVKEPYCLKCGKQLDADEADRCTNCKTTEHIYDRGRALFLYPGISESIYKFKYGSRPEYSEYYAEEIFKYLGDDIKAWNPDGIIAVPLHTSRMRKRGYNQAALIARGLSKKTGIPYYDDYVKRCKKTIPMKELNASERQINLKRAFIVGNNDVKLYRVLIVDDIYTTGSTIDAMADALKQNGTSEVYFVTLSIGSGM